jgi:hypothetical protein
VATYTLTIPGWHPARLNHLLTGHWRPRYRLKRADADTVAFYARLGGIPRATGKRRVSLRITLGYRQRAGDPDCYWKSLLDALKTAGLIVDDDRFGVDLGPERATTILLEDVGPQAL